MIVRRSAAVLLAAFLALAGGLHGHATLMEGAECVACTLHAASDIAPVAIVTSLPVEIQYVAPLLPVACPVSRSVESAVLETGPPVV